MPEMQVEQSLPERKYQLSTTARPQFVRVGAAVVAAVLLQFSVALASADTGVAAPVWVGAGGAGGGTPQIISSDIDPTTGYYSIINILTGADRFYNNGYFGFNTLIANVEAGYVWNGHETLGNVTSYISNAPINDTTPQYDYHATAVGFAMVGLGPPSSAGYAYYQFGMAPGAFLSSVAIATDWVGTTGAFNISSSTFVYGYKTVMQDGVEFPIFPGFSITRTADVVNSSWGYSDPTGTDQSTRILDALTYANHQTVTVAAGNHDSGTAPPPGVNGPATAFNVIAVGALGDDTTQPPYQTLAPFSNTGPADFYNPKTGKTITGVRPGVSIVAPGSDLILAAYTGATGTNADGTLFDVSGIPPDQLNQLYFLRTGGTSFASPIVAGGAALLVDAGYANFGGGPAVDGRVIKAVLLNSATKTPGWDNHTTQHGHVLFTAQGLDNNVGAGALNLNRAYDQFLTSSYTMQAPGTLSVQNIGWAFSHITAEGPHDYMLVQPLQKGDILTVTADWFVPITFNSAATADPLTDSFSDADLHPDWFDTLDLQVWRTIHDDANKLIAECYSPYINVDQLYFNIPQDGTYDIRVSYAGTTYDLFNNAPHELDYAIAWSVTPGAPKFGHIVDIPEPGSLLILLSGPVFLLRRRARRPGSAR